MIRFRTEICKSWFGRPKLVIKSTHTVDNGILQNMFTGQGDPMLDVADAMELRVILDEFISEQTSNLLNKIN